jgi:hypothetical protein
MDGLVSTGIVFGVLTLGIFVIMLITTYAECQKTNVSKAFSDGLITAIFPSVAYALGSYFTFVRAPFVRFFQGFGIEDATANRLGLGYIVMLCLLPVTVWAANDSTKAACVPTIDEMSKFKTDLLAKLHQKQQDQAAAAAAKNTNAATT